MSVKEEAEPPQVKEELFESWEQPPLPPPKLKQEKAPQTSLDKEFMSLKQQKKYSDMVKSNLFGR